MSTKYFHRRVPNEGAHQADPQGDEHHGYPFAQAQRDIAEAQEDDAQHHQGPRLLTQQGQGRKGQQENHIGEGVAAVY